MAAKLDLTGLRFGRLVAIRQAANRKKQSYWHCACDCGVTKDIQLGALRSGHSRSCGCLAKDKTRAAMSTHGATKTAEYKVWRGIVDRCNYPTHNAYRNYGGRGVTNKFGTFEQFFAELGARPSPKFTVERIDNNGHYEPGNVRWATRKEQAANTRRAIILEIGGVSRPLTEWAEISGVSAGTLHARLKRGWCASDALTKPLEMTCTRKKKLNMSEAA